MHQILKLSMNANIWTNEKKQKTYEWFWSMTASSYFIVPETI